MNELEIAFDTKEKFEYFIKYIPVKYAGELLKSEKEEHYIFKKQELVPKKLGTFLLDFLNTNFNIFTNFKKFIFEYMFIHLFLKINNHISADSLLYDNSYNIILSKEEINFNLDEMFRLYKDEFIEYQNIYKAIANHKYCEMYYSWINKNYESYNNCLKLLSPTILNLKINSTTTKFNELYNYKNITNSFISTDFYEIIYISFKELLQSNKNIKILNCKNCGKYFIPDTNHKTIYCDFLFDGKRSCKEVGSEKAYTKKLEQDRLLNKYRQRYQSLAKQASSCSSNSSSFKMYEYYKKEGPIIKKKYLTGNISTEEFEEWINNTKLRKNI